jgi:hypothetical protein
MPSSLSNYVLSKFNPNHDELGRFSSGSGNSKKVGPGGLLFHITDKKNRKSIEQNGFRGTAENPLFMAEQPHPFSGEDVDVYVIDTSGVKLFPDTKRLIDRSRKSYFSETPIPLGKFRRLTGEEFKVVYETHNSFKWNPDVISKFNPYHDELGRFTFASGGRRVSQMPKAKPTKVNRNKKISDTAYFKLVDAQEKISMTEDQLLTVRGYSNLEYIDINNFLRGKPTPKGYAVNPQAKKMYEEKTSGMAKDMTSMFDDISVPVKEDCVVFRGIAGTPNKKYKVGSTFTDKGFSSTSIEEYSATDFIGHSLHPVMLVIKIKKGHKVLPMHYRLALHSSENEILLRNGTKFRIIEIVKTPLEVARERITVEIVGN